MPMRTTMGSGIAIKHAQIIGRASELGDIPIDLVTAPALESALDRDYTRFFPAVLRLLPEAPEAPAAEHVGDVPVPSPDARPACATTSALRLSLLGPAIDKQDPRSAWLDVEITLEESAVVGGVCYAGNPFLPYI